MKADKISLKVKDCFLSVEVAGGSNMIEDQRKDIIEPHGECGDQQSSLVLPCPLKDSNSPTERITCFVNKYIDYLEGEWQIRRNVWLENNRHNPHNKRKKTSVYAYETFREYMDNGNHHDKIIDLQVPFNLPDVGQNNRNPISQDMVVPTQESFKEEEKEAPSSKEEKETLHMKKSLERITCLCICCLKLNMEQKYAPDLHDMTTLPGVKVLSYLSLPDFMNCRLVSKSWNNAVITHKKFLSRATFVVEKKQVGALAVLEASRVRWQHFRCSVLPSTHVIASSTSYNRRFLSSHLRQTRILSRNEPVTHTLTSVIFENIDIHKQEFVQWIHNCKRLNSIEVRHCNFLRSTISMNMDKANRVMERVHVMKFADMDMGKLAEALRFFLPATRHLHTLEILQRKNAKGNVKSATFSTRKKAEDSIASVLCPALKNNESSLKNMRFELSSSINYLLQCKIMEIFQDAVFRLNSLAVRSFSLAKAADSHAKADLCGSPSQNLMELIKSTLISSKEMTLLDFPMLSIDFVNGKDGSHLLSPKLEMLGAQLEMPEEETKLGIQFPHLSQLELYGRPLENAQWLHVSETMPGLTQLVVFSGGIRDSQIQSIIRNLKLLQVLRLESVQDVTDFGITGMEQGWIDRLKMYWPEKIDSSGATHDQFPRDKIRFSGKPLSSLADLHTFSMKGDFIISNVGILYGFHSRVLGTLELHGSPVNVSNSGLFILGFQCPCLTRVQMTVQHSKVNQLGIRGFHDGLEDNGAGIFQIDILPSLNLGSEEDERKEHPMLSNY